MKSCDDITRLAACRLGVAVIAPGLSLARPGVTSDTVLFGESKNDNASKFTGLTIIARDGKLLR